MGGLNASFRISRIFHSVDAAGGGARPANPADGIMLPPCCHASEVVEEDTKRGDADESGDVGR